MSKRGRPRVFKYDNIIDAAMKTFWKKGYEACSTQDLCKDTGLGKGSLYNTFGSKHDLFKQVLERYQANGIRDQLALLQGPISVKSRLHSLLAWALAEDFEQTDQNGCLLINVSLERPQDPMVEGFVTKHVEKLREALVSVMEEGLQTKEISKCSSAEELASLFLSSYYGLRVLNTSMKNRDLSNQIATGIIETIFST
ncbi:MULTISPECIES: TetR/AcrR family transcriptional regulator [unclassified Bacillus (in: firmicutes)]|uniref:TetR/AcrR family transcriptional regulator n=1 Tax=unclassified Bacillus (in: firmicutes) TaxID=185979 RepID=UPI001BE7282E|nr:MULTISPECIES: TetR/AcrR family transcriptional regulator [unclassified Bacillus (in: firmicutes)]MBT2619114.1 TetR/AcrR family transcriptional regulator [Bacillus sp. ISL-78]MBT2632659.1 TetR/AcrR family transcriptional regulator [Bacillus sp. ISL-101]MBT2717247.1 TetR/AcrR family transcriptional regulator [Bacillus sp. ISL-57]